MTRHGRRITLDQLDAMPALVDRCVCMDTPFADLIDLAARDGLDARGIAERTGCGAGCETCLPYLRLALATGRASLPVLEGREIDRLLAELGEG